MIFFRKPIYYTYLLECQDGTIYTGYTKNLFKRLEQHKSGNGGAIYTKTHKVNKYIYFEAFKTRSEAYKREWEIKSWDRNSKKSLAKGCLKQPVLSKFKRKYQPKVNPFIKPQNILSEFSKNALLKILAIT